MKPRLSSTFNRSAYHFQVFLDHPPPQNMALEHHCYTSSKIKNKYKNRSL